MAKNRLQKKIRIGILAAGVFLLVLNLFTIDYTQDLSKPFSTDNVGAGLRILSNIFIIAAMIVSLKHTSKKE